MAWTEVSSKRAQTKNDTEGSFIDLAFPSDVTAGDMIVVGGGTWDTEGLVTDVAVTKQSGSAVLDTIGHTTSPQVSSGVGATAAYLAWAQVLTGGSLTMRATPDSSSYMNIAVTQFTGGDSSPLDVNGGGIRDETILTSFVDTITPGVADALIVGVVVLATLSSVPVSVGSGYTQIAEDETFTSTIFNMEFRVATTPTTYNVDWSTTNTGSGYAIVNASFKPSAAGPGPAVESAAAVLVDTALPIKAMIRAAETR